VWNLYGPTETTIYSSAGAYVRDSNSRQSVSIGKPIANTQIYLLDERLQPVPVGVTGELYIGGDGVARGYLNRPDVTAEKFIADPIGADPGARLYRTGDLARYLPDGSIVYLGRTDQQVKIRGYRIECGEIEAAIRQCPGVQEAVVIARQEILGASSLSIESDRRLMAYVVPKQGLAPSAHELRSYLTQKLPEYMLPSVFVFLDSLPLTPNGKLDRAALPAPDRSRPDLGNLFVSPRTLVEDTLAKIWLDVLKLDKVGIHDNFFELGGHSLLATQVVSRVRDAFQMELPLRTLFDKRTVCDLAKEIAKLGDESVHSDSHPNRIVYR
jgi:acyl-CoA synthetase (AMP-forming)/AMP-acid ligase II/acyl carrier protein